MEIKINGYWLGLALICLIDYSWLVFKANTYDNTLTTLIGTAVIISLGLAIKYTPSKPYRNNG